MIKFWLIFSCLITVVSEAAVDDLLPDAKDIGSDWQEGTGVVITDLNEPPASYTKSMEKVIQQFLSIGVKGMANLAYRKKSNLMHQVELKLFEFDSIEVAQAWQAKKYGYENWQQHYLFSKEGMKSIYDSRQITKRIVFYKNYWITVSTITDTDDHLLFLGKVIERILEDVRPNNVQ